MVILQTSDYCTQAYSPLYTNPTFIPFVFLLRVDRIYCTSNFLSFALTTFYCQFDIVLSHWEEGNLYWRTAFIRLAYGTVYERFSLWLKWEDPVHCGNGAISLGYIIKLVDHKPEIKVENRAVINVPPWSMLLDLVVMVLSERLLTWDYKMK